MISNQTCDVVQSVQNQVVEIVCESRKNTSPYMYPFALSAYLGRGFQITCIHPHEIMNMIS